MWGRAGLEPANSTDLVPGLSPVPIPLLNLARASSGVDGNLTGIWAVKPPLSNTLLPRPRGFGLRTARDLGRFTVSPQDSLDFYDDEFVGAELRLLADRRSVHVVEQPHREA